MHVAITGAPLTPGDVVAVARQGAGVTLAPQAMEAMRRSRSQVEALAAGERPVYGISTGFGALADTVIPPERRSELQHALVRSHAAGMGGEVEAEVVRGMMLLRLRTLATGRAGVRPAVAEALASLLNAGITPVVPAHGSLGASGDLAPLAHVAVCLIGEGAADDADGRRTDAAAALRAAGVAPLRLEAKEGLSLVNGTDGMLAMLVLACEDARLLLRTADVAAAMSVEALLGTDRVFEADLQALRPHPGQADSAANLARLLAGSAIVASHRHSAHAVQDSYSVRCSPQVAGAARDTLAFAVQMAGRELAAAVDNPVVLADGRVESNGNFHGEPLAFACDFLAIAAAEVGAIAERRIDRLLDPHRSAGLPPFLAVEPGVNSGLMLAQYTAAALVAENRLLAHPASTDSLPTSGMQEDHVSLGWSAGRKLRRLLANVARVLAVELLCAARALDLRAPLHPAIGTAAVRDLVRAKAGGPGPDRLLAPELAAVERLVRDGAVLAAAETALGEPLR
ncbi:MAG TPA: histidine ammonia-lyase [Candidatus Dormibacteraeota bacterium]|nr:histidine ammonia-lyase [Candidatus Dormibacteraeota bacterium]